MAQYELNFRDYWRILRRRLWVILLTILLVAGGAIYYNNSQTPIYQATAQVRIERPRSLASTLMDSLLTTRYYENPLITEAQSIQSRPIAEEVARRLRLVDEEQDPVGFQRLVSQVQGSITAKPMQQTSLISIVASGADPDWITDVANLTAHVYIEQNLYQKTHQAREVREFIESQLTLTEQRLKAAEEQQTALREQGITGQAVALEQQLFKLQTERAELLTRATELHPGVGRLDSQITELDAQLRQLPATELEYARVSRELKVNEESYANLRKKLEEARIAEAEKTEDAQIVNPAMRPSAPIRPNKQLGYLVGSLLGVMLGVAMAFVTESLDTSLGTIEDVESLLQVPVLGILPHIRITHIVKKEFRFAQRQFGLKKRSPPIPEPMHTALFVHFYPKAPEAEAFRALRTNLKISPERKVLLITSSGPREGKTNVTSNLGVAFAQAGSRVLLVASDLRKPELPKALGIRRDIGLTEVLAGSVPVEKAIRSFADFAMGKLGFSQAVQTPGLDNLFLLSSGHIPTNPSEILGSQTMRDLIQQLRRQYDLVILDSPPLLPVADGMLLAPLVDGVVLIYEVGRTARAALVRTKTQVETTGGKILGVVLNHIRPESYYPAYPYYRYRYRYDTSEAEEPAERATKGT